MTELDRRRLIQTVATASALTAAPSLAGAVGKPAKLNDIDHIIILMKENR